MFSIHGRIARVSFSKDNQKMASLNTDSRGSRRIQFTDIDGRRKTIRLGDYPLKTAETIKTRIEYLLVAQQTNMAIDLDTAKWVASIGDDLADKLAAVQLIPKRETTTKTLGPFLKEYVEGRQDVRPDTKVTWRHVKSNLLEYFGASKALQTIMEADADAFKQHLIKKGLAMATIAKRLQVCRMMFKAAMRAKYISVNPFQGVSAPATVRADRFFFVTREMTQKLLDACPDVNWRLFVVLGRFGGFRVPSEACSLRWQDVLWDQNKIVVQSPKGERYGKGERIIPMFPELRPILEEAFEQAQEGDVYCVEKFRRFAVGKTGWVNCSLGSRFAKIIKRAGLVRWPRLFHALRASRETELAAEWPLHIVTAWLGNTPKIAMKHYLMVTESDFQRATQKATYSVTQKATTHPAAKIRRESQE
ncbi:MAG: phage integrase SAM-like domain-containing protein, partial [Thermoguttaceae bacterium]